MNQDSYGIYVHIPFCSQFCVYCDFYSVKQISKREPFIESLKREILLTGDEWSIGDNLNKRGVRTIYFGGGTPSVLAPFRIKELLDLITKTHNSADGGIEEITIEVNPDDITAEYLKELRSAGFNRLSIGIQSFDDNILRWMNRRHTGVVAQEAFYCAREAGFENISIDLIFGYEMLSDALWQDTLGKAISLDPEHISAYQMGVEPETPLHKLLLEGRYSIPDDETAFGQYKMLQELLSDAGYLQYEVSNFAKPGRESIHNSSYWNFTPYLGLGPSAHSFSGKKRSWNCDSVSRYINEIMEGGNSCGGFEILEEKEEFCEFIMLSLRSVRGIDRSILQNRFPQFLTEEFHKSVLLQKNSGNLTEEGGYIKIPSEKLFVSDGIIRSICWD